jgi:hypothetical protein
VNIAVGLHQAEEDNADVVRAAEGTVVAVQEVEDIVAAAVPGEEGTAVAADLEVEDIADGHPVL